MIGSVRRLDKLGRITLPVEMRTHLGLYEEARVFISMDGDRIILQKATDSDLEEDMESLVAKYADSDKDAKTIRMLRGLIAGLKEEGIIK